MEFHYVQNLPIVTNLTVRLITEQNVTPYRRENLYFVRVRIAALLQRYRRSNLSEAHATRDRFSSFYSQAVLIYLYPFRRNSLLKSTPQPQIAKNTKTLIWKVQGHSRSPMFTPIKSLSLLLVIISSMSLPICNRFHATRANSGKITTFMGLTVFDDRLHRPP